MHGLPEVKKERPSYMLLRGDFNLQKLLLMKHSIVKAYIVGSLENFSSRKIKQFLRHTQKRSVSIKCGIRKAVTNDIYYRVVNLQAYESSGTNKFRYENLECVPTAKII